MQAECLRSPFAPLAARYRSCSSSRQRTCAGVAPQAIRAKGRRLNAASVQTASARPRPSARALNSRPGQLAAARAHQAANARPRPSAWALKSRPWQLAIARAHQTASARPRPSAWALKSRPWQLAAARAHRTASARPRPSAWALNSPPGSSLSLVLIEPPAHVRGGCTPGNSRRVAARDNSRPGAVSYAHACANRQRTCAPGVVHGTFSVPALYILQGPP